VDRETTPPSGRLPVLSDFVLLEKVGDGGTGEVYRARQFNLDRVVALKVLRPSLLVPSRSQLLDPEVLTSLRHPHVVADLLHLDFKPENVLCDSHRQVIKITDFGLSFFQTDARLFTALEASEGTLDYCAPEQRFGLGVDVRTDLPFPILGDSLLTAGGQVGPAVPDIVAPAQPDLQAVGPPEKPSVEPS
jgi:serine/threonine protein kinase